MRYVAALVFSLLLTPFGSGTLHAQPHPVASVESEVDARVQQALDSVRAVPGLQVAIIHGDSIPY